MKDCLITFRSIPPAQRGEKFLRTSGLSCSLQRTPAFMQEQGCGYSLSVPARDAAKCVALLRQGRIPFQKVYLRRERGSFEELSV